MATFEEIFKLMKAIFNISKKCGDTISPFDEEMLFKILLSLPSDELSENLLVKKLSHPDMEAFYVLRTLWERIQK